MQFVLENKYNHTYTYDIRIFCFNNKRRLTHITMELKVKFFSADDIQKKSDFRLWIALTDGFINKSPNLIQLSIVFRDAILALTMAEYKGYSVFLAGHGLGGITPFLFLSLHCN